MLYVQQLSKNHHKTASNNTLSNSCIQARCEALGVTITCEAQCTSDQAGPSHLLVCLDCRQSHLRDHTMCIKLAVRSIFAVALFGMAFGATAPARADVQVGVLTCRSLSAASYIIVSDQPFNCVFTPSAGGPVQYYQATVHRVGVQVGFSSNVALGWAVFAPTASVGTGALAGNYGGVSAGAAIGVGVGANGLVGGNNSFALQPVSVEGQSGLNVVATATQLQLQAVAVSAHHYRHHRHYR